MLACAGKLEHQRQGGHVSRWPKAVASEARLLTVLDILNALNRGQGDVPSDFNLLLVDHFEGN